MQEPKRQRMFLPRYDNKESMSVNVSPAKFTMNEGVKKCENDFPSTFKSKVDAKGDTRKKVSLLGF